MQDRWRTGITIAVAFLAGCVVALLWCRVPAKDAGATKRVLQDVQSKLANVKSELTEIRAKQGREHELDVLRRAAEYAEKQFNEANEVSHEAKKRGRKEASVEEVCQRWARATADVHSMFQGAVKAMATEYEREGRFHYWERAKDTGSR